MSSKLNDAFSSELFRNEGHKLIDQIADYLSNCYSRKIDKAIPWKNPDEMLRFWQEKMSAENLSFEEIIAETLNNSVHLHHPRYIGHQVAVPIPYTILSEMVSALLNAGMVIYETGETSTAMEKIVTDWLCKKIGYGEKSGGVLTSGGSLGNLTALLAARQKIIDYDVWEEGLKNGQDFIILVSEEAHYSISRAGKILGLGNGVVKVPADKDFQMDMTELNNLYNKFINENKKVIAVVASACTTSTGTYDKINEIANFCIEKKLWFHIDAAHGGGVMLSNKYKHLIAGVEKADSVVIDFHKMLLSPGLVTGVSFKNNNDSYESFAQKASYLWNKDTEQEWFNIGKRTIECTKKMMSLKIFVQLKIHGEELLREYIESRYDAAKEFADLIKINNDFELLTEPQSNIVCFRFNNGETNDEKLDDINREIRQSMLEDGKFYIVQTIAKGRVYLRTTIMNPFTDKSDFAGLLDEIKIHFKKLRK
ncbi:MAG: aminotransferase class I/II-fold pyridoxal phosphate-dependent enzyme [Ignavibacteriales bacterium]|nr:aminotransferase class I/II-fold pyridoxal phosphate-dependent enzyme [Ignavibacteriales bacterium]